VYGNDDFSFDITFSVEDDMLGPFNVTEVSANNLPEFLEHSVISDDTIRISRIANPFTDEEYEYVSFDENFNPTIEILNPDEAGEDTSIISWKEPDIKDIIIDYVFQVSYLEGMLESSEVINITQTAYWKFEPSLAAFLISVEESKY
jgi:hypothetical protein